MISQLGDIPGGIEGEYLEKKDIYTKILIKKMYTTYTTGHARKVTIVHYLANNT